MYLYFEMKKEKQTQMVDFFETSQKKKTRVGLNGIWLKKIQSFAIVVYPPKKIIKSDSLN